MGARADLMKAKEVLGGKEDKAIARELKLLDKDEKSADKAFYAKMRKQMQKAQKKKKEKKALKKQDEAEKKENDSNPNLKANLNGNDSDAQDGDDKYVWDLPADQENTDNGNAATDKSTEEPKS